jgi:alpha,alpha-trehalase
MILIMGISFRQPTPKKKQTGEGQELNPVTIQGFNSTPAVLDQIDDQFYKGFVSLVNGYWALLIR